MAHSGAEDNRSAAGRLPHITDYHPLIESAVPHHPTTSSSCSEVQHEFVQRRPIYRYSLQPLIHLSSTPSATSFTLMQPSLPLGEKYSIPTILHASPISACISPHPRLKSIHVQLLSLETETTTSTYTAERCASTGPALPLLTRLMVFPSAEASSHPVSNTVTREEEMNTYWNANSSQTGIRGGPQCPVGRERPILSIMRTSTGRQQRLSS